MDLSPLDTILVVLTIALVGVGIALIPLAVRQKQQNFWWLVGVFVFNISTIFATETLAPYPILFHAGGFLIQFSLIMFLHTTFYNDRRSPYLIFMFITIAGFGTAVYFAAQGNPQALTFSTLMVLTNWTWHLVIAVNSYGTLSKDPNVEDWVKARFVLMIWYVAGVVLTNLLNVLRVFLPSTIMDSLQPIGLLSGILSIVLQYLTWTMPAGFRNWLNRNQQARAKEQVRNVLGVIGSAMSDGTGYTSILALFNIRKMIGNMLKTEDPDKIEKHIAAMGYNEWLALLDNPNFFNLLKNSALPSANVLNAVSQAKNALTEKQSLFTMQAK